MSNYNKEIFPEKENTPFTDIKKAARIIQKYNAVCKIRLGNNSYGTGFFCIIKIDGNLKKFLFTNNHILNEENIKKNNKINIIIEDIRKEIEITDNRFKCTDPIIDYTCIEIMNEDNLNNGFFEIDNQIDCENPEELYKLEEYIIIQYPQGKGCQWSDGNVSKIEQYNIYHDIPTDKGSSGSPIIALTRALSVIGIHCGGMEKESLNKGIFFKYILEDIKKKMKNDEKTSSSFIGVDLGTTTSCVGIMNDNNEIEILQDRGNGSRLIPSVVCFTNKTTYVGDSAINIGGYSKSKIYESKRLIGHKWDDKIIEEDIKRSNVKIIKDKSGYVQYSFKINNEEIKKYPEEISLEILKYIKEEVEIKINKKINNIIITIPAHYNNDAKSKINKICEQAGFKKIEMINEPTAAGIAYLYEIKSDKLKTILIFDIGGGNFGISILKIKGNEYKVLASEGEEHLGGEDFNRKLFDYVIKEIKKDPKFKNINLEQKDSESQEEEKKRLHNELKIKKAVENLKNDLSKVKEAELFIDLNYDDFKLTITKEEYKKLCGEKWKEIINKLNKTFNDNKVKKSDIEEIILIGGSSRTPGIQEELKNQGFNKNVIFFKRNSEEFTSMGATLYGNNIVKENLDLK